MVIPKFTMPDAPVLDTPTQMQASFKLEKVIANIRRGTTVLHYPATGTMGNLDGSLCNHIKSAASSTAEWGRGTYSFGNWSNEMGEVFYEILSNKGYYVLGDPKKLFRSNMDNVSPDYLVGARIKEMRGNICQNYSVVDGRPLNEYSGELYLKVEWRVFSVMRKREILIVQTQGYGIQKESKGNHSNMIGTLVNNAFEVAAEQLLESKKFMAIALRKNEADKKAYVFKGSDIELPRLALRTHGLKRIIGEAVTAVVGIVLANGHGSGFAISKDGHILTNAHVVGKSSRLAIRLSNGLEVEGRVLSVNEERDVALVKAPIRFPRPLPIRAELPNRLDRVVVIGSPMDKSLQSTVTAGVVSAFRRNKTGLLLIQSDAAISGGNSGGPMLDENGNVIAITVSGVVGPTAQNLNLFIPIKDALEALKITLTEKTVAR